MNEEQKNDIVKKTKIKMWVGLVLIIVIGLAIAIYFVFLKKESIDTTSLNNWKTYTNEIHNFSFQYPPDVAVVIDEPKREVDLKGPLLPSGKEWPRFYIANYPGDEYHPPEGTELKAWITEKLGYEKFADDRQIAEETAVHINTIKNVHDDQIDRYYFLKNGQIFQVDILHPDGVSNWDIYNKFLDSIAFNTSAAEDDEELNFIAVNTSDWLIFDDAINGFRVKYPSDYLIKTEEVNHVVFDSSLVDMENSSLLQFTVDTSDTDMQTYRLGVVTDEQVDTDTEILEEDVMIDGLEGDKITLKNKSGETIIHYLVSYLGKTYDISAGDSLAENILLAVVDNFGIYQFSTDVDITSTALFLGKECVSNNDCGAYPCNPNIGKCLVQDCTDDSGCFVGVCGLHATPVPGYCTTMDSL